MKPFIIGLALLSCFSFISVSPRLMAQDQDNKCKKIDEQTQKYITSCLEDAKWMTQEEKEMEIDKIEHRLRNIGNSGMTALNLLEAIPVFAFIPTAIALLADDGGNNAKQTQKNEDGECYSAFGGIIYPLFCMLFGVDKTFMPVTQDSFNEYFPSYTEIKELIIRSAVLQASIKK